MMFNEKSKNEKSGSVVIAASSSFTSNFFKFSSTLLLLLLVLVVIIASHLTTTTSSPSSLFVLATNTVGNNNNNDNGGSGSSGGSSGSKSSHSGSQSSSTWWWSSSSWNLPHSSSSSWWSSSSASSWSSGSSGSSSSDEYSVGSSFYTDPDSWHNAGYMKQPFAQACTAFTLDGYGRLVGGFYTLDVNASGDIPAQDVLRNQAVVDMSFPDTQIMNNKSLPAGIQDKVSGPGSCAVSTANGMMFVFAGNNENVASTEAYALSDDLSQSTDISLPFPIKRSSIAATVMSDEDVFRQMKAAAAKRHNNNNNNKNNNNNNNNNNQKTSGKNMFFDTQTLPDAVVVGGQDYTGQALSHVWGLGIEDGLWQQYCAHNGSVVSELCDCVVVSRPFAEYVLVCNNCTNPTYHIYLLDSNCQFHNLIGPSSLRDSKGLDYVHGIAVGKFSVFVYHPRNWLQKLVVAIYDHELHVWADFAPDNLVPPRIHGSFFSWLGRVQLAGGQDMNQTGGDVHHHHHQDEDNNKNIDNRKKVIGDSSSSSLNDLLLMSSREATDLSLDPKTVENHLDSLMMISSDKHDNARRNFLKNDNENNNNNNKNKKKEEEESPFIPSPPPPPPPASSSSSSSFSRSKRLAIPNSLFSGSFSKNPPLHITSVIQDVPIVRMKGPFVLASGTTFNAGTELDIDCDPHLTVMFATAPDCLHPVAGSGPARCGDNSVGKLTVSSVMTRAYLCATRGTCHVGHNLDRCGDVDHVEFSTCSANYGCCWHPYHGCYHYEPDVRKTNHTVYYYLANPAPYTFVPAPTTTPSPNGPNNNHGGNNAPARTKSFIHSTTGKIVIICCAAVVGLAIILAVIFQIGRGGNLMDGGGKFDLHEFVAKRYDVIRELGRGGFGTVYHAIRKADKKELALKVIACSNDDDVQSALMEFAVLRQAKPHPGMMPIIDIHVSWEENTTFTIPSSPQNITMRSPGRNSSPASSSLPTSPMTKSPQKSSNYNNNRKPSSPTAASAAAATAAAGGGGGGGGEDISDASRPLMADGANYDSIQPSAQQQRKKHIPQPPPFASDKTGTSGGAASGGGGGGDESSDNSTEAASVQQQGGKIQQQQFVCIVMEYFSEGDLAQFVAKTFEEGGGPTEAWLWTVLAKQIFSVLAHLHATEPKPIVHRDMKPENILLASGGNRLVLTDFGLATQVERSFMSTRAGSFHYLAPECWSHRYTASVDVWSAGCILYAAATGCVAPPAARVMFNDARHPSFPQEIRDDLRTYSNDFANLVLSILKMDPNKRPTAQQVMDIINEKCKTLNLADEDRDDNTPDSSVNMTPSCTNSSKSPSKANSTINIHEE